jgi:diguanylate cyclase (GGDEF)-like protein
MHEFLSRWFYARRYSWLLGAVLLLTATVLFGLVAGVRHIEDALPINTLHKQRDFSALLMDVNQLTHSVDRLVVGRQVEDVESSRFLLQAALNRVRDTYTLYASEDEEVHQFCDDFRAGAAELDALLARLEEGPALLQRLPAGLAKSLANLRSLQLEMRRLNDDIYQSSALRVTMQRDRLENLRRVLILGVVLSSVGAIALVLSLLRQKQAYERLQALDAEIRNVAFYDHLTGLANRRLLMDRLRHAQFNSHRSGQLGALLFIDLDNFKTLNDTEGHDAGDRLLVQVAERLLLHVRAGDTVSRFGGDEFLVMLENLGGGEDEAGATAERVAEKLRAALKMPYAVAEHRPFHHISPSIGIALFEGQGKSVDQLIKHADLALYQAKEGGRDSIRFFSPSMQQRMDLRFHTEAAVHAALDTDQFCLHLQPLVTPDGRWVGAEALLRWQRPEHGLVGPSEFIEIAEESGLIVPLGDKVLTMALEILGAWSGKPAMAGLVLAVNVSAKQFRDKGFVPRLSELLQRSGVRADRLKLELTESVVLHNLDEAQQKMQALRDLGISLALDDFGTGYSSLTNLKQLPFDTVKIDRSFVRDIGEDRGDEAICSAVIQMAHELGLRVVAEGVETDQQRVFLTETYHCDWVQGFLFGRPQPVEQFERHFAA